MGGEDGFSATSGCALCRQPGNRPVHPKMIDTMQRISQPVPRIEKILSSAPEQMSRLRHAGDTVSEAATDRTTKSRKL